MAGPAAILTRLGGADPFAPEIDTEMALLNLRDLTQSFGGPPVLDGATLRIEKGDRVCLFGRNGEGKSTLLRIVSGQLEPDSGSVDVAKKATVGVLDQEIPTEEHGLIFEIVTAGLGEIHDRLQAAHQAADRVSGDASAENLARLERAQTALEAVGGWEAQQRVETVLTQLGLDGETRFSTLSGGWRRRVYLAQALTNRPDILLLDEPTNHLDIEAIEWLEEYLTRYEGALLFVTHDRAFVRRVATRIVELDRGSLVEYPPGFDDYLRAKHHAQEVEATQDARFDKKLADEEAWIRRGTQARRTRNEGRVRALIELRKTRAQRRTRTGVTALRVQESGRSGDVVIEAEGVTFRFEESKPLIENFSGVVKRGDRIGLIGPNGAGKSTLLRLLLGEIEPRKGAIVHGTRLQIRYYDQLRDRLDPKRTVAETVAENSDTVTIDGQSRHIIGYLRDFLFDRSQAQTPVGALSGGERNRLLLAKLFAEPANVLVLDEPTNDLDMETLEVLEDRLLGFSGTVLLVSHDRELLNRVVTECLVFEGQGQIRRVVGGYEAWDSIRQARRDDAEAKKRAALEVREKDRLARKTQRASGKRLSHADRTELDSLPAHLEALEAEKVALHARLDTPEVGQDPDEITRIATKLEAIESEMAVGYQRWEELEAASEAAGR